MKGCGRGSVVGILHKKSNVVGQLWGKIGKVTCMLTWGSDWLVKEDETDFASEFC